MLAHSGADEVRSPWIGSRGPLSSPEMDGVSGKHDDGYRFLLLRGGVIVFGLLVAVLPREVGKYPLLLFLGLAAAQLWWVVRHVDDERVTLRDRLDAYHLVLIELALGFTGVGFLWGALVFFMVSAVFLAYTCRRYETTGFVLARQHALTALQYAAVLILMVIVFARAYQEYGLLTSAGEPVPTDEFSTHLYFSMVTWTTLGFGDFKPEVASRVWAAVEGLCGYVFLGLFLLILPSLLAPRAAPEESDGSTASGSSESSA